MENISTVVLIVLVAAVVVAVVIGAGIELIPLGVSSADQGGGNPL